eukprot:716384-Alexandrium_andersonii.AAC.1
MKTCVLCSEASSFDKQGTQRAWSRAMSSNSSDWSALLAATWGKVMHMTHGNRSAMSLPGTKLAGQAALGAQ